MGSEDRSKDHDRSKNEVVLRGRVSGESSERELPSGDRVAEFRIVVARDDRDGYDTLDIAVWKAALRKRVLSLKEDEWVEVDGVIRRRFWRAGGALASRWQVEGREVNRI